MKINNKNQTNFTSLTPLDKPLGAFFDKNAIAPIVFIESGVTLLRSKEANKRGGKKEAVDRFIEQGVSAAVWIWGVQALKSFGDKIGKSIFGIDNLNFNIGKDSLRNPVKNNKISSFALGFKASNTIISTFFATYFIGFVLPKISRAISKKMAHKKNQEPVSTISFEEFKNKTKKKDLSFTSLLDKTTYLADIIENNSTARLLLTDSGVVLGRCKNAPNIYRKIENLFRDISSIYFYLFSTNHIVKICNKLSNNTNISPKVLNLVVEELSNKGFSSNKDDFINTAIGVLSDKQKNEIDLLFKDKEVITLEKFLEKFPSYKQKAIDMSNLQPVFNNKHYLLKTQAQDVLKQGVLVNPLFLNKVFNIETKNASSDKFKFVPKKQLDSIRTSIDSFIEQIQKQSKNNITITQIEKIAKKNTYKNFAFYSSATLFSTLVLGIVIPKIQYLITKKLTNKNEFLDD